MFEFEEFNASPQAVLFVSSTYVTLVAAGCCINVVLFIRSLKTRINWKALQSRVMARACSPADGFALLFLWIMLRALHDSLTLAIGPDADPTPLVAWAISFSLVTELGVVLAALILVRLRHGDTRSGLGIGVMPPQRAALWALAFYLGAIPVFLASTQIWGLFLTALDIKITEQEVVRQFMGMENRGLQTAFIVLAVAGAPITEELVFRGVFLPTLTRRLGVWYAAAAVSLIFALVHTHLPTLLPLFVISLAFSLGYILTGSILVPIFMHALFNGVSLACVIMLRVLSP